MSLIHGSSTVPLGTPPEPESSQTLWAQLPDLSLCMQQIPYPPSGVKRKASSELLNPTNSKKAKESNVDESRSAIVVAYSYGHHAILKRLPWILQYEIARYTSTNALLHRINICKLCELRLCATMEEGLKRVRELFEPFEISINGHGGEREPVTSKQNYENNLCKELEREAKMINAHRNHLDTCTTGADCEKHHLYLSDDNDGWYGGKVHFTGKLLYDKRHSTFAVKLEKPVLQSSTSLARSFGSEAFLSLRVDDDKLYYDQGADVQNYLRRPLLISGRVFRAFYSKNRTVFFYCTNEVVEGEGPIFYPQQPTRTSRGCLSMSLLDFLNWYNPININQQQSISKWASRFGLGLSDSIPGIKIAPECVERIGDIVSPGYKGPLQDLPAELIMTDGCGLANAATFELLRERLRWDSTPTVIQMRFNGAKGLLILHPDHATSACDRVPRVWIRASQQKITYPNDNTRAPHPAFYTIDVLDFGRMNTPARLSSETVINLAHNGVPVRIFKDLVEDELSRHIDGLTLWETGDHTPKTLWNNIAHAGGVFSARVSRRQADAAYNYENNSGELCDGQEKYNTRGEDPISGLPYSLHESAMQLLQAGFRPDECPALAEKLVRIADIALKPKPLQLPVAMSCKAFVIPDPTGTLASGEVHIRSSRRTLRGQHGQLTETIEGDVLLTRHPCKLPTDFQRATAVYKYELRHYIDVIVVSVQGHKITRRRNGDDLLETELLDRHLASMTGGGDYDGDVMEAFWDPKLLADFQPADSRLASKPEGLANCLKKSVTTVHDFVDQIKGTRNPDEELHKYQEHLLGSLINANIVSLYSSLWEQSTYQRGYSHPNTILLAYIFCKVLDGKKTGITVNSERLKKDRAARQDDPDWKKYLKGKEPENPSKHKSFVMDHIVEHLKQQRGVLRKAIEERLVPADGSARWFRDKSLSRPWEEFETNDRGDNKVARALIILHVHEVWDKYDEMLVAKLTPVQRQNRVRELSQLFAAGPEVQITIGPTGHDIATLKASYAYVHSLAVPAQEVESGKPRLIRFFPFELAFRALCGIKARSDPHDDAVTIRKSFYESMTIKSSLASR